MSSTSKQSSVSDDRRVITKYPNRRLYDTSTSCYVSLSDVKRLVMDHTPFWVRDAKTGVDLTRSILLQIILEEETDGTPLMTEPMLANLIRFYGHAMQTFMGTYLEKNVQTFMDFQSQLAGATKDLTQLPTMHGVVSRYMDQSTQVLADVQEKMQAQLNKQTEQMMDVMRLKR